MLVCILFAETLTSLVVATMSLALHGRIRLDFMFTGFVTSLFVTVAVVYILLRIMRMVKSQAQELQTVNERLTWSMARMPVAFIVWDTDFCAVEWNQAAERIFGYAKAEALGHTPLELFVPPEAMEPVAAAMANLLDGQEAGYSVPGNNVTKDGRIISCLWFNVPLRNQEERVQGVLSMALDVTEREEMGRALQEAKEKAEAANQAKSHFLAAMSHEIRTPLNVVLGMSELLLETGMDAEQHRYARTMHHAGKALLGVINDILDFSRIEAGRIYLVSLPFSPGQVVQETVHLMQMAADEKGLILEERVAADIPPAILGDDGRLRQILINLLGNAVKFTERGRVDVGLTLLPHAPDTLLFTVTDTGIGIPEEQTEHIFEQFTQADVGITRRYGGTGLGLAITRRLVALMGGRIWVESRPGHGSTFSFSFPARLADGVLVAAPSAPPAVATGSQSLRILLAEDQEINRMLFAGYLNRTPHRLVMVDDGDLAVARVREEPFDLVFMDVRMPRMDGYTATRRIREWERREGRAPLRIIALSALAIPDVREDSRAAGCDACLSKPIGRKDLLALLDQVARERSPVPAPDHLHVLLVEDIEENQVLIAAYLQKSPHRLVIVHDGLEALAKVREEGFDVVLMDVQMPRMDGYTATRHIRQWEAESGRAPLMIFALTAHAMEGEAERSREAGCDRYLVKPISKKNLLGVLADVARAGVGPA